MTKEELIQKIQDLEWEDFEVKKAKNEIPKNTWETVSAFSNTRGGWIVFGVEQKGKQFNLFGVDNPEKIEQDFTTTLRGDKFNIKIIPKAEKYSFDGNVVLAFYIPISDKKPIYYNSPKNTFIRIVSGDQKATPEEVDTLYRDQAFGTQSSKIIDGSNDTMLHDHSIERYIEYLARFNSSHVYTRLKKDELLSKLQIVQDDQLTYAGLLMFGKNENIQRYFPDFRIDLFEIPGTSYTDATKRYTYRMQEQENLWEYYFSAFERIRQKVDIPFNLREDGFAVEDYPYLEALREALVNLLMHTDYFSPAKPRIRIFDDHIDFNNPGGLPKTLKKLLETDQSLPRNPILAKIFRAVKLAENAGFGLDKMFDGWKSYQNKEPIFKDDFDSTIITFPFSMIKLQKETTHAIGEGDVVIEDENLVVMTWIELRKRLGKNQIRIIEKFQQNSKITAKELAKYLGLTERGVEWHIDKLRTLGIVDRIGAKKGGYWIVNVKQEDEG